MAGIEQVAAFRTKDGRLLDTREDAVKYELTCFLESKTQDGEGSVYVNGFIRSFAHTFAHDANFRNEFKQLIKELS